MSTSRVVQEMQEQRPPADKNSCVPPSMIMKIASPDVVQNPNWGGARYEQGHRMPRRWRSHRNDEDAELHRGDVHPDKLARAGLSRIIRSVYPKGDCHTCRMIITQAMKTKTQKL